MKKSLKNVILTTLLILILVVLLNFFNFKFLFSFHSFINDKAFALKEKTLADTNIVLVNLGSLNRSELSEVLKKVSASSPKAVGIHACLDKNIKTPYDSLLKSTLTSTPNLVLLTRDNNSCLFEEKLNYAPLSLVKDDDEVIRSFISDSLKYFELELVKMFNPTKYTKLINQNKATEQINYIGNLDHFFAIDHLQVINDNFTSDLFKNKVVLIGYLGSSLSTEINSLESAVYTPLNERLDKQKVVPDMYSVVVSANVISTILQENYIEEVPKFVSILIIICLIIFNLLVASILIESSFTNFLLFLITAFVGEVFLGGLFIVWLLNDHNKMIYLQELPVAIIISFIIYFGIHLKVTNRERFR